MMFPGFLKEAFLKLGGSFFILPSSVHEVLLAGEDAPFTADELRSVVRRVNASEVSDEEFLSDEVYRYDAGKGEISIE